MRHILVIFKASRARAFVARRRRTGENGDVSSFSTYAGKGHYCCVSGDGGKGPAAETIDNMEMIPIFAPYGKGECEGRMYATPDGHGRRTLSSTPYILPYHHQEETISR